MTNKWISNNLSIDLEKELGRGLQSTVYEGRLGDLPVAVKRILYESRKDVEKDRERFNQNRERTIMNKVEVDRHQNILGYYLCEIDDKYMYLAMQLCDGDLSRYVKNKDLMATYPAHKVNHDIAEAIDYIHSKDIAHRDLKPENVLYKVQKDRIVKAIVADFGFSKTTTDNMFSVSGKFGTNGYIAHEVWTEAKKSKDKNIKTYMNVKSDIFSMGCIFFYTESEGFHPFGDSVYSQTNIQNKDLPEMDKLRDARYELKDLLHLMLSHRPEERLTASQVLNHPAMWSTEEMMKYIKDASDDFETIVKRDQTKEDYLESADISWTDRWFSCLPEKIREELEKRQRTIRRSIGLGRKDTVRGALRTLRNVANHYREFSNEAQEELGTYPDGHVELWTKTCPQLFMHVYVKMTELKRQLETVSGSDGHGANHSHQLRSGSNEDTVEERDEDDDNTRFVAENLAIINYQNDLTIETEAVAEELNTQSSDIAIDEGDDNTGFVAENLAIINFQNDLTIKDEAVADASNPQGTVSTSGVDHCMDVLKVHSFTTAYAGLKADQPTVGEINRQTMPKYHLSSDIWTVWAKREIDEGKKTAVRDQIGRNYILCVDISESISNHGAWGQTRTFVSQFIGSLESLQDLYEGVPVYLALVTFGHRTEVVQRLTSNFRVVEDLFSKLRLGGPTPIVGGVSMAAATAGIPTCGKGNPTIIVITDGRSTESTLYEGRDEQAGVLENVETTTSTVIKTLKSFKDGVDFKFVQVGQPDLDFIKLMASVCGGNVYTHADGQTIIRDELSHDKDMYHESTNEYLPPIGSRVRRGPDWSHGDQDSNGPGTIIGHGRAGQTVWVEWDADGHQNFYQYGNGGNYDVLLTDKDKRMPSHSGKLSVGCWVVKFDNNPSPSKPPEVGSVIKVIPGSERVEVRWNSGSWGKYSVDENGICEVRPYDHTSTARTESQPEVRASRSSTGPDSGARS